MNMTTKPKPDLRYLQTRLSVDLDRGVVTWIDATRYHARLNGSEAGSLRRCSHGFKHYVHIKVDGIALKRSHIVYLFGVGRWPVGQIDHINGDSTDDRFVNLRDVTPTQNAWNHKRRTKKSVLPMGVRALPSGRFQSRIACNKKMFTFGPFDRPDEASAVYQQKRKEFFGEYA